MKMNFRGTSVSRDGSGSHRRTMSSNQIQFLELVFMDCTNPNEQQLKEISERLGIEPGQIRFWFQNRRTQPQTQYEQAVHKSFILENERLKTQNLFLKETMREYLWGKLGGKRITINEIQSYIEELQSENVRLKKEYERLVSQFTGKPLSNENSWRPPTGSPTDATVAGDSSNGMRDSAFHNSNTTKNSTSAPLQSEFIPDIEKLAMMKTVLAATDELKALLSTEPLWVQNNGRYSLDRECYETVFIKLHFKLNLTGKLESSKDSCDVPINAITLVSMILDLGKLLDLFPTLVTNAETLQVIETGMPGRSASLKLMREVKHALSPLVAPREFYFLRYCHQVDGDTWIIVDVSDWALRGNDGNLVPHCHKLLSGCMIQDKHDGHCKVSRVELVEMNEDTTATATHSLYSDLVSSGLVFGAERWIATLKRMCERELIANEKPDPETLLSIEGKRSLMDLSQRMVKEFCATLKMPNNEPSETDDHEVRVSTRQSSDPHNPGVILCGTTSLWLPFHPKHVFSFFKDESWRYKWDFLALGRPVTKIAGVVSGRGQPNGISVFKPDKPYQKEFAILEETFSDLLGYYVVCAPVDFTTINKAVAGLNTSDTPILSSGFVISGDGRGEVSPINLKSTSSNEYSGSLLTVVFQTLFNHHPTHYTNERHWELVRGMKTLVSTTVTEIKDALIPSSSNSESPPPSTG